MNKAEFKLEKEIEDIKHKYKMLQLETEKKDRIDIEKIKFDFDLQLQRIKSAEIRKNVERKMFKRFGE